MSADTADRTFRYMNGYTCLAGECPDTCCAYWRVPVDEAHYESLRQVMSAPADRELFERVVEREPEASRTPERSARLKLDKSRHCPFLDEAKRCSLHARFGEDLLPDACATFPRLVGLVGQRRELSGCISCPEVARRALDDDYATDLVAPATDALGRGAPSQELRGGAEPAARLDTVRDAMYEIVSTRIYPLDARLFALAHLAYDLDEMVGRRGDPAELSEAVEAYTKASHIGEMHKLLSSAPPDGAFGLGCVLQLFAGPLQSSHSHRFADRAGEVLSSLGKPADVHEVWRIFAERRNALDEDAIARVNRFVFNYVRHACMSEWYSSFPSLRLYVQTLLLRVTTLRFLTIGHPALTAAEPATIDEIGIQVFYSFSRAIERNALAAAGFYQLAGEALPSYYHTAPLLRV